jgi:hypothetical protein
VHVPVLGAQPRLAHIPVPGAQAVVEEQQTPLLPHWPFTHWSLAEQVPVPVASLVMHFEVMVLQYAVAAHCPSSVQDVVQLPFPVAEQR